MDRALDASTRRRRLLRRLAKAAPFAVLALALVFGLPRWLRPSLDRDRVRTARVERGPVEAVLVASGTVVPAFEVVVSSPVEARVVRVLKRAGDAVAAGDEILDLDFSAARLALAQLEDRLAQKANERERLDLDAAREAAELAGRIEVGRLDAESARYRLEQRRTLAADGLVAAAALQEAEVEAKKAALALARLEDSVASGRWAAAARAAAVDLDAATLRKERDEMLHRLDLASARADRAGVLTWVVPQEGVTVRPGDAVARIADLSSFRVEATLSDAYSGRLASGLPARVVVDGEELAGAVSQIYPAVENGAVRFAVDFVGGAREGLRPNLRVDVLLVTDRRPDALRLTKGPFAQGGGTQQVFVVEGDRAVRRAVEIGLIGYRDVEILSGLVEGDEVIVSDMTDSLHQGEIRLK